jgi:hypothetical protein
MTEDTRTQETRAALRAHLLHCGFVDPDDGTVPVFTGNDPHFAWTSVDKLVDALHARFDIRDRQAAPRVWFPGDTVPAGTPVVNHVGGVWKHHADRVVKTGWAVELQLPADAELQAAVDRARTEQETAP